MMPDEITRVTFNPWLGNPRLPAGAWLARDFVLAPDTLLLGGPKYRVKARRRVIQAGFEWLHRQPPLQRAKFKPVPFRWMGP